MTKNTSSADTPRPLSPHLQIYRWQLTMALSITHRVTGAALAVGTAFLVAWLWAAAYRIACFEWISGFFSDTLGRILLFGWSLAFYFHLCNGVRHLFWDIGKGFALPDAYRSGYMVLGATAALTAITWIAVFHMGGLQ